jgi:two-component system sensor histidine kinase UhpB
MRSLALSVVQRCEDRDVEAAQAARLIADEASRLYDAMHGLIPRLTPLVLDRFGLPDALADLVERTRRSHPQVSVTLQLDAADAALAPDAALALYRAAQEGITNALRHGGASAITLVLRRDGAELALDVTDDGSGLAPDWQQRPGHHGLRWMAERLATLRGRFALSAAEPRGVRLTVAVPLEAGP